MPRYRILQRRDAIQIFTAEIDAASPEKAFAKAESDQCTWLPGETHQLNHREISLGDVEEINPD